MKNSKSSVLAFIWKIPFIWKFSFLCSRKLKSNWLETNKLSNMQTCIKIEPKRLKCTGIGIWKIPLKLVLNFCKVQVESERSFVKVDGEPRLSYATTWSNYLKTFFCRERVCRSTSLRSFIQYRQKNDMFKINFKNRLIQVRSSLG